MSAEPTRPDAASIERGRLIAESMMDHATAAYRARLAEERSDAPRPPAEVHPGATGTPDPTTDRGTGEAGPETSAQAGESVAFSAEFDLGTPAEWIMRNHDAPVIHTEPAYPPATIPNEALPYIAGFINAIKAFHYREAAASLRVIVERRTSDQASPDLQLHLDGIRYAAERLDSTAKELEDEGAKP